MSDDVRPAPYWNPYVAGIGLGLTLLIAFLVLGAGLGASGSIARLAAEGAHEVAPRAIEDNAYLGPWFQEGAPLRHYLVFMTLGVLLGGVGSAWASGRMRAQVERGPRMGARGRLVCALLGGLLVGWSSRLAMGCTSGQALTGGALLLSGSWAFMLAVFAGGYGAAWFVRKEWV
ncbi:MAG: YeeE/YedE family protein [Planctomycetes bacterium]|nr:YeeE/YedE family protein [Planctomycetota bacterium]MCB9892238.1 YeeE/YedE family protein [Planctomycetota bacterium]